MNDTSPPPAIGHNSIANLSEILDETYLPLMRDIAQMVLRLETEAPDECKSDADAGVCSDLYKDADTLIRRIESHRVHEKAPFLEGGTKVDSFFKGATKLVAGPAKLVADRNFAWLRLKREAAARELHERAEALRRQAEAERKREAEAAAAAVKARLEAEGHRKVELIEQKTATAEGHETRAATASDRATLFEEQAAEAERAAEAPASDLARTRGKSSLGTLQEVPAFEVEDWEIVPLDKLRPYLDRDAIGKAIKGFMTIHKAHVFQDDGRKLLAGVRFFKTDKGQIRRG